MTRWMSGDRFGQAMPAGHSELQVLGVRRWLLNPIESEAACSVIRMHGMAFRGWIHRGKMDMHVGHIHTVLGLGRDMDEDRVIVEMVIDVDGDRVSEAAGSRRRPLTLEVFAP